MDSLRFQEACEEVIGVKRERSGIGTLSEKTLHAVLKKYLEPHAENHEVPLGNYVADIIGENGVIEIQTGSFTPLRPKLEVLLDCTDVTVAYPIAEVKYMRWIDPETGEVSPPHKSPKKGRPYDAFYELIKIKYTLDNPHMHFKILMLELTETRWQNGRRSKDRKRGSQRCDRIPQRLTGEIDLLCPADYDMFIPQGLPEKFCIKDFEAKAGICYDLAQIAVNILTYLGRLEPQGKSGRMKLFSIA